ncbi:MAG: DUF932 domain-containing protein [Candidatus Sericytochromatia bacterium]|nr:DUF932 domain-containing protein [Candidatus Tanganyikabacteria bacterium]
MQTLVDLLTTVSRRHQELAPEDVPVDLGNLGFRVRDGRVWVRGLGRLGPLPLADRARSQLLVRLGIPEGHFHRCPDPLKEAQLKWFLRNGDHDRRALVRTVHGREVRAILGSRYAPLDDALVLPLVAGLLADTPCTVEWCDFSADSTHVRLVFERDAKEVRPGDVVKAGIHVVNSETGCRAIHIDSLVFRLVCSNGLVRSEPELHTAFRHVGRPERLEDALRKAILTARSGAEGLLTRFQVATVQPIGNPEDFAASLAERHGLAEPRRDAIAARLRESGDLTVYGAVNAITAVARDEASAEARYQLERVGAALLGT